MKKCEEIMELISLYIDDDLNETEKHQFEEHINSCIKCREELDLQMEIINLCQDMEEVELPEDFNRQLNQKLVEEEQRRSPLFRMHSKYIKLVPSVAAVFLLIFMTSAFFLINKFNMSKSDDSPHDGMLYVRGNSKKESLKDADGLPNEDVLNEIAISVREQDEADLFSAKNDVVSKEEGGEDTYHRTVSPDIYYDDMKETGSSGAGMTEEAGDIAVGGGMSSYAGEVEPAYGAEASYTIVRATVINKSREPEYMAYVVDTANKLEIEFIEDKSNDLVRFEAEINKYHKFLEQLESSFTNLKVNITADGGTEITVEILIE